jgi:hypothetical protein
VKRVASEGVWVVCPEQPDGGAVWELYGEVRLVGLDLRDGTDYLL